MSYSRFALYYVPDGDLAMFGMKWLGWDVEKGAHVPQFELDGLSEVTNTPRKYGFHGTLKPPFHLAEGQDQAALMAATERLAAGVAPAQCTGLQVSCLGGFVALTPVGDTKGISDIAETCVREIDSFRAPASASELARRRAATLSPSQEANLCAWGYPYVMDDFRFHLTLTGRCTDAEKWVARAQSVMPPMPEPFVLEQITLVGQRTDGQFEVIERFKLGGS